MSDQFKFVQAQPFTTGAGGASIGDTSLILSSMLDINGVTLAMTDFGSVGFGTLEPSSGTSEEQISFTGITQNGNGTATLTGVKTVLFKSPYTQTSGLAKSHAGGVVFVISNTAGFYDQLSSKNDDETITGLWDFPSGASNPTIGNGSYVAPTTNTQIATKKYVDDTALAGAPNASTTVKGIVQLPTQAQTDAKTATGSTGAALVVAGPNLRATQYNDYVADTGSASTYVIAPAPVITAYATGQQFTFIAATANTANSGVSTLAVNGLAQKTIKKLVSQSLQVSDILAGQVVTVVYDGTNFQVVNATELTLYGNGTFTKDSADASTTQNIAHGLGKIPRYVKLTCVNGGYATYSFGQSLTVYNGTAQSSASIYGSNVIGTHIMAATFTLNSLASGATGTQTGVVTFDATNIIITWTKTGSPSGTYDGIWEANA